MVVGGGPIDVELAGEIIKTWPGRSVTIVESGARILGGTAESVSAFAAKFLERRGVVILTGERIESPAPGDTFAKPGEARTTSGRHVGYDVIFWCIGGRPNTVYLQAHFSEYLDADGRVRVTPQLRVEGEHRIFALGDITNLKENKMALHINGQVPVAEANIRAILAGKSPRKTYKAKTGNLMMAVSLGRLSGVAFVPPIGTIAPLG